MVGILNKVMVDPKVLELDPNLVTVAPLELDGLCRKNEGLIVMVEYTLVKSSMSAMVRMCLGSKPNLFTNANMNYISIASSLFFSSNCFWENIFEHTFHLP